MHRIAPLLIVVAGLLAPASAHAADPTPFGHACKAQDGVRFCPGAGETPSWDGVPLDVDVTLPAEGNGPFPTIAMLHGYGGSKASFQATDPEDTRNGGQVYRYNNTWFARRGYAVINHTARGFAQSCGQPPAKLQPGCFTGRGGYIHLKDQRVEAHDTQFLLGSLVDAGLTRPDAIGVTGISYGGGESIELAFLRDRIRKTDGTFEPWTSPKGTPLRIAAAWPRWPWSDLVGSLVPNGRFLDFRTPGITDSRTPIGVPIESYITGLYALGNQSGSYAPPGTDPTADITPWYARLAAGDPYTDATVKAIADEIVSFHQGFGLDGTPAPLLIENGWTDDLFPPREALRIYNHLRATNPNADVALQVGDLGHSRGSNKLNANQALNTQGSHFFDALLKGASDEPRPAPGSVTAFTQTCPKDAPAAGPFGAGSWVDLHPGAVRFGGEPGASETVTSGGGNPDVGAAIDPIANSDACKTVGAADDPTTVSVRSAKSTGYTLMGLPTVTATIKTTGSSGQLASRLWDVAPDGKQTLVSRGAYRLEDNQEGTITFQLSGNGWRFERDHVARLELLGRDAPYLRPSNNPFSVDVKDVTVELPTLEKPTKDGAIVAPVLGRGETLTAAQKAAACAARATTLRARGVKRGVRFTVAAGKRTVEIRQQSVGRRILDRRVARLTATKGSVTWSGKGKRVRDGVYVAIVDGRKLALRRKRGRFTVRPAFQLGDACGPVRLFHVTRPVFGGTRNRALGIGYRPGVSGTATVTVLRGRRVVARIKPRAVKAGTNYPLSLRAKGVKRGDIRVRLSIRAGKRTTTRTITALRL